MKLLQLLPLSLALSPLVSALWPVPSKSTVGNSTLWFSADAEFSLSYVQSNVGFMLAPSQLLQTLTKRNTLNNSSSSNKPPITEEILDRAIRRTYHTILKEGFIPWRFHARNAEFEPTEDTGKPVTSIKLQLSGPDSPNVLKGLDGEIDESYSLKVTEDGEVTVFANSSIGLVRGLTTFTQLFFKHSTVKDSAYTPYAPVDIQDHPAFAHRGLNMDVSRSYYEVDHIKRTIDALAYSKMNRLHLHITDAQSWPLEIPSMPELSAKGAYNKDLVYTPDDVAGIQRHGALQGVQVIIEIDMPGHTSSIWYSHPELIASFNEQPDWSTYSAEPPSGTLHLNDPAVYTFIQNLLKDLLPRISPYTAYFHTGGDEIKAAAYINDPTIKSNITSVIQPYLQKFVNSTHDIVRQAGLTPMVWEEMVLDWNLTLGSDVVVQTWQESTNVNLTVSKGYKTLAGNYYFWYLDCGHGQWINFPPNQSASFFPYNDYCAPFHNWRVVYSYDPLYNISAEAQHLVIGGEVHAWAEQTDGANLDRVVWPRAAAAAEILWSGAKDPVTGGNRSQVEAAPRLSDLRERLVAKGIYAEPIQMAFCTMGDNQCNLG
ncbi:hypothetical protein BT63DRAFT_91239 [Microthyrium microscopicum]|uniref:Beta-hexosaminidase n=1 Tax=Microthyrium microscopicum TaxID=703497 RepID=A0A6A6TXS9_9PEZI|nr:hypothetical protein BT63DRAFT_91239 [Microthyrium microscopicum]